MTRDRIPKNSIALAGEFAVLSQLAFRGFDASLTLGNTKNIDVLVFDPNTEKSFQVEVKTARRPNDDSHDSRLFGMHRAGWMMSAKHEKIRKPGLFYCFVLINERDQNRPAFRFYIVPSGVVAKYIQKQHRLWLKSDRRHRDNPRRIFRIGLPDERRIEIPAPLEEEYEDNWGQFEVTGRIRRRRKSSR